jgi:Heparinase II/III N-terminus/Heparinase II/III-like protein
VNVVFNFIKNRKPSLEEVSAEPQFKLSKMNPENLIKFTGGTEDTKRIADLIINNQFYLTKAIDIVDFTKGINWNYTPPKSANTYQLYLHTLNTVSYLVNQFEESREHKYLDKAYDIIKAWSEYNDSNKPKSNKVWADHPAASRVMNMVYFFNIAHGEVEMDDNFLFNLLLEHARYLADDDHYNKNNHGIMVDRALITAGITLAEYELSRQWIEKGIYRLREAFFRDFSSKGVHLENSPEYHSMVLNKLFIQTQNYLVKNGLTIGEDIEEKLEMAKNYFPYIMKPNHSLPIIGDSGAHWVKKVQKNFDPFVDFQAGIAVMQAKVIKKPAHSTWMSFIAGYGSKTHKHQDDLSFTLFYKGKDIFIDSGKYNYDKKDKLRNYITSPFAHNTLAVEGKNYKITHPQTNREKIKITDFTSNPIYDYVKGINYAYDDVQLERAIVFIKPNIIIVLDKVSSEKKNKYLQIFNLAPHITVTSTTNESAMLDSNGEPIEIIQLSGSEEVRLHEGDRKTPRAVISEKFGTLIDNKQVEFTKTGENTYFLTAIKLGSEGINRLKSLRYMERHSILKIELLQRKFDIII